MGCLCCPSLPLSPCRPHRAAPVFAEGARGKADPELPLAALPQFVPFRCHWDPPRDFAGALLSHRLASTATRSRGSSRASPSDCCFRRVLESPTREFLGCVHRPSG